MSKFKMVAPLGASVRNNLLRHFLHTHTSALARPVLHRQFATALAFLDPSSFNHTQQPVPVQQPSSWGKIGSSSDDRNAEHALTEALQMLKTPHQLRQFFVHLLVNENVLSPITTWRTFRDTFARDFIIASDNMNIGINQALQEISRSLEEHGKSLSFYGLPEPSFHSREVEYELAQWSADPNVLSTRAAGVVSKLNKEQYHIYTEVIQAVESGKPLRAFVDGKAGRGKTFLVNAICAKLRSLGRIVLPTATSGFAAQLYPGGKTTHATFKVPIGEDHTAVLNSPIEAHDPRGELIREASVIIWDEAPMANSAVLRCVEETCRRVMHNDLPFGGKVIVLLGDFRQTCPVIRYGTRQQIVDASISSSPLWKAFSVYRLTQPVRNAQDLPYAAFVDSIGDGLGPHVELSMLERVRQRDDLINFVYPEDILQDPVACLKRAILAPTNEQVDGYNREILSRIDGVQRTFTAADLLKDEESHDPAHNDPTPPEAVLEDVARQDPPGIPAHSLTVKVNGVYRLMCNFSPDRGLVKNTRIVVMAIGKRVITVRVLRGVGGVSTLAPEDILISRIPFTVELESGHTLVRRQFPLAPAYATTFNSCQGLTLDFVGLDLTRPVFSHGQLYTALSRIRHRSHAKVRLRRGQFKTRNVTYQEILP